MKRKKQGYVRELTREELKAIHGIGEDIAGDVLPVKSKEESDMGFSHEMMVELAAKITADFDVHLKLFQMRAKLHKAFYDALRAAGFSKEEAMEILKARQM